MKLPKIILSAQGLPSALWQNFSRLELRLKATLADTVALIQQRDDTQATMSVFEAALLNFVEKLKKTFSLLLEMWNIVNNFSLLQ